MASLIMLAGCAESHGRGYCALGPQVDVPRRPRWLTAVPSLPLSSRDGAARRLRPRARESRLRPARCHRWSRVGFRRELDLSREHTARGREFPVGRLLHLTLPAARRAGRAVPCRRRRPPGRRRRSGRRAGLHRVFAAHRSKRGRWVPERSMRRSRGEELVMPVCGRGGCLAFQLGLGARRSRVRTCSARQRLPRQAAPHGTRQRRRRRGVPQLPRDPKRVESVRYTSAGVRPVPPGTSGARHRGPDRGSATTTPPQKASSAP